jgi:hypothetical protein
MKKYFILLFTILSLSLQAQGPRELPRVKEMQEQKWQHIVQEAGLTEQEAAKAQPVFMEYEQAVWNLMEKNRSFFMGHKRDKASEKPDFSKLNENFVNTEIQKAQLLKTYYHKLKKAVSDEKIFKMGAAERSFRKELVKDWQGRRRNANP